MQVQVNAVRPPRNTVRTETVPSLPANGRRDTRPSPPRPIPVPRGGRRRVLVVEDEQDIADLIRHTLERGGDIEVELVTSGDAALKSCTEQPPDLVLLDLEYPGAERAGGVPHPAAAPGDGHGADHHGDGQRQ